MKCTVCACCVSMLFLPYRAVLASLSHKKTLVSSVAAFDLTVAPLNIHHLHANMYTAMNGARNSRSNGAATSSSYYGSTSAMLSVCV